MSKYGLHGKLQAKPGQVEELATILLKAAEMVAKAPGCYVYMVSRDASTPDAVWVTEAWESRQAHDDSLKAPEVRELIAKAMPLLEGMPEGGQVLEILGGQGVGD